MKNKPLRKTLAMALSTALSATMALGAVPTTVFGALGDGQSVTVKFVIGDGAAYDPENIEGYTYDGTDFSYSSDTPVAETASLDATVTLFSEPDTIPDNKQFVGWEAEDGNWIEDAEIPLNALGSAEDGQDYAFTAVYKDFIVNYDLDGGQLASVADGFFASADATTVRGGLDLEDQSNYALLSEDKIMLKNGYESFVGWALDGNTDDMVTDLADYDFAVSGVANLQAIYGDPSEIGSIAYCNTFDGLDAITSLDDIDASDLISVEDGVDAYTVETGEITPVPADSEVPAGQEFDGWDVYSIDDMTTTLADEVTSFDTSTASTDLVFVANWANATYDITYTDLDGYVLQGDDSTDTDTYNEEVTAANSSYEYDADNSQDITLPRLQSTPSTGHTIAWSDGEDEYGGGDTYTIAAAATGDIDFVEVETPETYTITYCNTENTPYTVDDPEDANYSAVIAADTTIKSYTYDDAADDITLPVTISEPSAEGKEIVWDDGDNEYVGGADYAIAGKYEDLTFTERERTIVYDVTYHLDDGDWAAGTTDADHPATICADDSDIDLSTLVPEKEYYDFVEWRTDPEDEETAITTISAADTTADVDVYAIWSITNYYVVFDFNADGTDSPAASDVGFVEDCHPTGPSWDANSQTWTVTVEDVDQNGDIYLGDIIAEDGEADYAFVGWDVDDSDTPVDAIALDDIVDAGGNITAKAVWRPQYTVAYSMGDGTYTIDPGTEDEQTFTGDEYYDLVNSDTADAYLTIVPTYPGHTLVKWTVNGGGNNDVDITDNITTTGNNIDFSGAAAGDIITVTATWESSVDISYNTGGGEVIAPGTTGYAFSYLDTATSFVTGIPTYAGYAFDGWKAINMDEGSSEYGEEIILTDQDSDDSTFTVSTSELAPAVVLSDGVQSVELIAMWDICYYDVTLTGITGISASSQEDLSDLGFTFDDSITPTTATLSDQTVEDAVTIPEITFGGHNIFTGWDDGSGSSTDLPLTIELSAGDIISDLSFAATSRAAETTTINFTLGGGAAFLADDATALGAFGYVATTTEQIVVYEDDDYADINPLPVPQKDDNVFTGWTVGTGTDKIMEYVLPTFESATYTLTATWVAATEGETVVQTEGDAAVRLDNDTVDAIKGILDDNVGEGEISVTKITVDEDTTGADHPAGSDIDDAIENAFTGSTVPLTKVFVDIDIVQYTTSVDGIGTKNSDSTQITNLGQAVDFQFTPTNGVTNLQAVVREHTDDNGDTSYTQFTGLDDEPTAGATLVDGTYWADGSSEPTTPGDLHSYNQLFSTFALGYATGVYKVSFDVNGGNETYDPVFTDTLGALPAPTRTGYWAFDKWAYADGSAAATGDTITADTVLTAQWIDTTPAPPGPGPGPGPDPDPDPDPDPPTTYKVTFNTNGGTAVSPIYVNVLPTPLPTTTKNNYDFVGWLYANGTFAKSGDVINANTVLTAKWSKKGGDDPTPGPGPSPDPDPAPGPGPSPVTTYTITFDANGGIAVAPIKVSDGKLPVLPTTKREGYVLIGWFYQNGEQAAAGDAITGDITLTAQWESATPGPEPEPEPDPEPAKPGEEVVSEDGKVDVLSNGDGTVTLVGGAALSGAITIDEIVGNDGYTYKVTAIADKAFAGNDTITSITVSDGVVSIGNGAFSNMSALKSLYIGNGVEFIDEYAAYGCANLSDIVIGANVSKIGKNAFGGAKTERTVIVYSTKLTKNNTVGKASFKNSKKTTFRLMKKNFKKTKKVIKKKGGAKKAKFKKIQT